MKKLLRKWYFWTIALFTFLVIIVSSGGSEKTPQQPAPIPQTVQTPTASPAPLQPSPLPSPTPEFIPAPQTQPSTYEVTSVIDGDTIKTDINGATETIRIIGINTPETVDPRAPVQCFGIEASNEAKTLLSGKTVILEADASQGERDKYGRLLRYVFLIDGTDYGKYMISSGYAYEYTYNTPYKYQAEYKTAQANAQTNQMGLWSSTTCNGSTKLATQTAATPTSSASAQYYTSSYATSKYYYPASCDGWKSLSPKYLQPFDNLEALLSKYPNKIKDPNCQ